MTAIEPAEDGLLVMAMKRSLKVRFRAISTRVVPAEHYLSAKVTCGNNQQAA
jgi:hypothetical protein